MAIIKSSYQRRARGTKAVMDSFRYYSFRAGPDLAARRWYGRDGSILDFNAARAEIRLRAAAASYTYRITLSTHAVALSPDDYRAVLGDQFVDYYFVPHLNTDHPHAHVLAFSNRTLRRLDLAALRERLQHQEQTRMEELAAQIGERQEAERQPIRAVVRRHERGYELD